MAWGTAMTSETRRRPGGGAGLGAHDCRAHGIRFPLNVGSNSDGRFSSS